MEVFPGWLRIFSNTFGISAAYMFGIKKIIKDIFSESNKEYLLKNIQASGNNGEPINFQFMKTVDLIYNDPLPIINEMDLVTVDTTVNISVSDYESNAVKKQQFDAIPGPESTIKDENDVEFKQKQTKKWEAWELLKQKSILPNKIGGSEDEIQDNKTLSILKDKLLMALNIKRDVGYFLWYFLVGIITVQASTNTVLSESCSVSKSNIDKSYSEFVNSVKS